MIRSIALFTLLLSLSGCTTTANYAPSNAQQEFAARTAPEKIELYRSQVPSKKYSEIGAVSACCSDSGSLIEKLKERASEVGGDALIGIEIDATGMTSASVIRYQ